MEYSFSPEEAALLFALYGQQSPPVVGLEADVSSGKDLSASSRALFDGLVSRGLLTPGADAAMILQEGFAKAFGVCLQADVVLVPEVEGVATSTVFRYEDMVTVIDKVDGSIVFRLHESAEAGNEAFARCVGAGGADAEALALYEVPLDEVTSEKLLECFDAGDQDGIRTLCLRAGWDFQIVAEILYRAVPDVAGSVRLTALFRDLPARVTAKILCEGDAAWLLKFVFATDEQITYLIRCNTGSLLGILCDVSDWQSF